MFSITKVSEGEGQNAHTYSLTSNDGEILHISCWKGDKYYIGDFNQVKWLFYSIGEKPFPLPEHIRKKFAQKGKWLT